MKKKSSTTKNQNPVSNISQKTFIIIIALLFAYYVFISTNSAVDMLSHGLNGRPAFYNLLNLGLITIFVPAAIFLLFYKLILSNNKKTQLTSVVFYSVVYTLFAFVIQGAVGHYVFNYTFNQNITMVDWQFFTLLLITYIVSVLFVFGGLALSNPQASPISRKKR